MIHRGTNDGQAQFVQLSQTYCCCLAPLGQIGAKGSGNNDDILLTSTQGFGNFSEGFLCRRFNAPSIDFEKSRNQVGYGSFRSASKMAPMSQARADATIFVLGGVPMFM